MRIIVDTVAREQNSRNGNPRFRVLTEDGRVYRTRPDTGDAYRLTGNERAGLAVDVELDENGEIYGWDPVT